MHVAVSAEVRHKVRRVGREQGSGRNRMLVDGVAYKGQARGKGRCWWSARHKVEAVESSSQAGIGCWCCAQRAGATQRALAVG